MALNNPVTTIDIKLARGRGILAFTKGHTKVDAIFPDWHTDRRAFMRINYQDKNALITGAIHADQLRKKEEIGNIIIFLQTISRLY